MCQDPLDRPLLVSDAQKGHCHYKRAYIQGRQQAGFAGPGDMSAMQRCPNEVQLWFRISLTTKDPVQY